MKRVLRILLFLFVISLIVITLRLSKQPTRIYFPQNVPIYLPLVSKQQYKPQVIIENEGANWSLLQPYYPDEVLAFSVNAGQLEEIGWKYFENKYTTHTGKIFLKLKGAYRAWADPTCKPIPQEFWDDWIQDFAIAAIDHVGSNRILWVEIGNEPDTDYSGYEYFLGCWGITSVEGQYYAKFIDYVYPILKDEYPEITFLAGAFMNPYSDFADGVASTLKNIDGISFHYYPDCSDTYTKLESIISLMDSMFVFPLYFSETNLVYATKTTLCDQKQAEYIHYLRTLKNLRMIVIYTAGCNTWKNADLIYPCSPITLKPAYWEFMGQSQMTEFPIPPP